MKYTTVFTAIALASFSLYATPSQDEELRLEIKQLQQQTERLQQQLKRLHQKIAKHSAPSANHKASAKPQPMHKTAPERSTSLHPASDDTPSPPSKVLETPVLAHSLEGQPESVETYPAALLSSDNHVITYIGGTPVITAPYLGSMPSFDGSDYIVNISSINRDVRLMEQRRRMYHAFEMMGYPAPNTPIVALSGKIEPVGSIGNTFQDNVTGKWDLGSAELDVDAALNRDVQAYLALTYDPTPYAYNNWSVSNSPIGLGTAFINVGDLDKTPYYMTAGQIYVPFGRYSSFMISSPLTLILSRTKARTLILGYKSQYETGPFAAVYGFKGDTTLNNDGAAGFNLGYNFKADPFITEVGASIISSIDNAAGMQVNGSSPGTTFAGFASFTNGSEHVQQIPAVDIHTTIRFDRYNLTAEWVDTTQPFRPHDLSYNGRGAQPQAGQLEAAATFKAFDKPASFAVSYQWTKQALALNLPKQRIAGVFNMSIWKDTVESIEYHHDIDYRCHQYGNGAAPIGVVNANTVGTGQTSDMLLAQIGVFF